MRKILILGAAQDQVTLIEASKSLGYYIVCCDRTTTNPGLALVDKHYQISYTEKDEVLDIARKEGVEACVSNGELAMPTVSYLVEKLNLLGNTSESIELLGNKESFRSLQKKVGVYVPQSYASTTFEEFALYIEQMALPIIIKPAKSRGTQGTTKIESLDDKEYIQKLYKDSQAYSDNGVVLIEEFIEMPSSLEIVEGDVFFYKGQFLWDGFFYNKRSPRRPMLPMSYRPLDDNDPNLDKIKETLSKIILESGIVLGAFNVELYMTPKGEPFVIEVNIRQGGGTIPLFIKEFSDIDFSKLLLSLSMGDERYFEEVQAKEKVKNFVSLHTIMSEKTGVYNGLYIDDEVQPYVLRTFIRKKEGDAVIKGENLTHQIGLIYLKFPTREEQLKYHYKLEDYIYPLLK